MIGFTSFVTTAPAASMSGITQRLSRAIPALGCYTLAVFAVIFIPHPVGVNRSVEMEPFPYFWHEIKEIRACSGSATVAMKGAQISHFTTKLPILLIA